ncbi:MAG: EAL domain-containing protein [Gammaproteobacteria bacterium]
MVPISLEAGRLENYSEILQRLCPYASGFAIYSPDGEWVSTDSSIEDQANSAFSEMTALESAEAGCMNRADLNDGCHLYTMGLRVPNDISLGTLVVRIDPNSQPGMKTSEAEIYSDLTPFLSCILSELRLNSELDAMAAELTVRYEELNLVYHTDDQVSLFDEGQNALKTLAENCTAYLNVSLAILYMPSKDILVASDFSDPQINFDLVHRDLETWLYDLVRDHKDFVAINSAKDLSADSGHDLGQKLLACPVADQNGEVDGILVMLKDLSAPDFTNGDKNLLAVMARKVTKIILGSYDALTGLMNRVSFEHLVERNRIAIQQTGNTHCLLHLNIDRLGVINDTLGQDAGNTLLKRTSGLLKEMVRDSDLIARIGGDEFGVLILNCPLDKAQVLAEKLRTKIVELNENAEYKITCRLGVSCISGLTESTEAAFAAAHIACDAAKELGGNRVQAYGHGDQDLVEREREMRMIKHLHSVIRDNELELYTQLIEPLAPVGHRHLEILLRMIGDDGEIVLPQRFLPAAERYQLMPDVDKWVIRQTCQMLAESSAPAELPDCVFAINLSGQSLSTDGFLEFVESTIETYSIPGDMICFEITETAAVAKISEALEFMAALKKRGCTFALDDFGAGLSSFGYLKTFPVDFLKIDGELVKGIVDDGVAEAMVAAVHQVGRVMGIETIAEYVENDAIKVKLSAMGINYGQGFAIQKPRPIREQLAEWRNQKVAAAR